MEKIDYFIIKLAPLSVFEDMFEFFRVFYDNFLTIYRKQKKTDKFFYWLLKTSYFYKLFLKLKSSFLKIRSKLL